jgi:hypothetical protein
MRIRRLCCGCIHRLTRNICGVHKAGSWTWCTLPCPRQLSRRSLMCVNVHLTTWREALTSTWAEAQMRVSAQSRAMPNVFRESMFPSQDYR